MGVRAIVVTEKKHSQYEVSIFVWDTKGNAAPSLKADPTVQKKENKPPAPLSSGMAPLKGCHFPSIPAITECRPTDFKRYFTKTYNSSTFVWKECKCLCIYKEEWGDITRKFGLIPSQFIPSLLSFSFFIVSGFHQCVSRCLSHCLTFNTLGWHIVHAQKQLINKTLFHFSFFSSTMIMFPRIILKWHQQPNEKNT